VKVARFLALLGLTGVFAFGTTVTLDNGVSGVGRWEVVVDDAASSVTGNLTHAGGTNDVIYLIGTRSWWVPVVLSLSAARPRRRLL
jgi:hypothetical protein